MEREHEPVEEVVSLDEGFLAELGISRLQVPVPFLEAGGPVNAYAIENDDGTWTLFDTGVGTGEGSRALDVALAGRGLAVAKLSRIIVSHGHVDHYGNAQRLAEASGARVWVHRDELEKVCGDGRWFVALERHRDFYASHGVPAPVLDAMVVAANHGPDFARQVELPRVRFLEEGQRFRFRRFEAEVLHLPGHTPGLVGLHAQAQRLFFADDHLLVRVSPNPLIDFVSGDGAAKFRALARYLESARRVYELPLDAVLPGHGPAFRGHRPLLDGLVAFYRKRQAKLRARLAQGPATAFELVAELFPRWDGQRLYLMLSEVLGNLEVLEDEGVVGRVGEALVRWALGGNPPLP